MQELHTKPLVVAATRAEIALSIPLLDAQQIPYVITGVGMVATAYALTKALHRCTPPYILNLGIAGSLSDELPIGSVVEIVQDTFFELGAENEDDFIPLEQLGFGASSWANLSSGHIHTALDKVEGITVNKVHGHKRAIQQVQQRLPYARTESMEGAAVFYVSNEENIPCIQVRSISNFVGPRDKSTWNIPLAIQNLHEWLSDFLKLRDGQQS